MSKLIALDAPQSGASPALSPQTRVKRLLAVAALALFVISPSLCHAHFIRTSLPDIDGVQPPGAWFFGPFTYSLPLGSTILSATLSGTYGTAVYSYSTASFDAFVDGTRLTVCGVYDPNCYGNGVPFRWFSFALPTSLFAALSDGVASLRIMQTTGGSVHYGRPTLTIEYAPVEHAPVPEPGTLLLLATGLAGLGVMAWRRARRQ